MTFANGAMPFPKYTIDEITAFVQDAKKASVQNQRFESWCAGYMALARQIADGSHRVECEYDEDGSRRIRIEPVPIRPVDDSFGCMPPPEGASELIKQCADRAHEDERERLLREAQELVDAGVPLRELRQVQVGMFGAARIVTRSAMEAILRSHKESERED